MKTSKAFSALLAAALLAGQMPAAVYAEEDSFFEVEDSGWEDASGYEEEFLEADLYGDEGYQEDYGEEIPQEIYQEPQDQQDDVYFFDDGQDPNQQVQEQPKEIPQEQPQEIPQEQPQQEVVTEPPTIMTEAPTETTTLAPVAQSTPMSVDDVMNMNGGNAVIMSENDKVTFIDGTFFDGQVTDFTTAASALQRVYGLLGIATDTVLMQYGAMADSYGNIVYRFRQMQGSTPIDQGLVKLYTDSSGHVTGMSSSVASYVIPTEGVTITASEAESVVTTYLEKAGVTGVSVLSDRTEQVLVPNFVSDQGNVPMINMWAVYTWNPQMTEPGEADMPFLAHYVNMAGEYRYSIPCTMPEEKAATAVFDTDSTFDAMVSSTWTGTVVRNDGSAVELTVPVMNSLTTGTYYLADPVRKIAVADCAPFLYENGTLRLVESADNSTWDPQLVLAFASIIQAYDFYKAIGLRGADLTASPILILKDFCAPDGTPVNRAVYAGKISGWQTFGIGSEGAFGQALDLVAHAYTHYVASVTQSTGLMQNDFGSVTESVCDILGNVVEMLSGRTTDTTWALGERTGSTVRSLSSPEACAHPAFAGDLYYEPDVYRPNEANDRGGVYADSSLVGLIAYRLYEAGMTLEQSRGYWTTVLSAINPGTTNLQLTAMLPWAMQRAGLSEFQTALANAMNEVLLGYAYWQPLEPAADSGLVTLFLSEGSTLIGSEPVVSLQGKDGQSVTLKSVVDESGALSMQVLPGDYRVSLTYLDNGLGTFVTWSYDGSQWALSEASETEVVLETEIPEGENPALPQTPQEGAGETGAAAALTVTEGATVQLSAAGLP